MGLGSGPRIYISNFLMVLMLLDWSHTFQNLATQGVTYTSRKDFPWELTRGPPPGRLSQSAVWFIYAQ